MITCEELDGFVDDLCDLTALPPWERARAAAELLKRIEALPQRFVMQQRAYAAADLHYVRNLSMSEIARQLNVTTQTVKNWLEAHGPTHYLIVGPPGGAPRLRVVVITGEDTRRELKRLQKQGWRVSPATDNLIDVHAPDLIRAGTEAQALWYTLGQQP